MRDRVGSALDVTVAVPPLGPGRFAASFRRHWRRWSSRVAVAAVAALVCAGSEATASRDPLLGERAAGVLWFFDSDARLTRVELDRGLSRRFVVEPGELMPMARSVAVFDGDDGTDVVAADGTTVLRGVGAGFAPVTDRSSDVVWALGEFDNDARTRPWLSFRPPAVEPGARSLLLGGWPLVASGSRLLVETRNPAGATIDWFDTATQSTVHVADRCALAANDVAIVTSEPCGGSRRLWVMSIVDGTPPVELQVDSYELRATISPNGEYVAVVGKVGEGARVDIFDSQTGQRLHTTTRFPYQWAWTLDSRYLIIADPPDLVAWRVDDGAILALPYKPVALYGLAITR